MNRPIKMCKIPRVMVLAVLFCCSNEIGAAEQDQERRADSETRFVAAVKKLEIDGLSVDRLTIKKRDNLIEFDMQLSLRSKLNYEGLTLGVDTGRGTISVQFQQTQSDKGNTQKANLLLRLEEKDVSNMYVFLSGTVGEWSGKDLPGHSSSFFRIVDLNIVMGGVPKSGH